MPRFSTIGLLFPLLLSLLCGQSSTKHTNTTHYPNFSWDTVPVYLHFGKKKRTLNKQELEFVAKTSNFIGLEKMHGIGSKGSTESGTAFDIRRLKRLNPDLKALFYWNSFLDYGKYEAQEEFLKHPDWLFTANDGSPILKKDYLRQYNILNPEFRTWWASIAKKAVTDYHCDGIFMDAVLQPQRAQWLRNGWGMDAAPKLTEAMQDMMTQAKQEMGEQGLLVYNGYRSQDNKDEYLGLEYLPFADGTNLEHLAVFNSQSKESITEDILNLSDAGKAGKIVIVKGWPGPDFNWTNGAKMREPAEKLKQEAIDNMDFPLACFLIAAQEHSYFCYSWGYREEHGSLVDYPQFHYPLGKPLGDFTRNGWEFSREFEHLSVKVNVETQEAEIVRK